MIRNLRGSHFSGADGFGLAFATLRAGAARRASIGASGSVMSDAMRIATMPRAGDKPYSAAAIRGRPTKPETSPKRSSITAGRSLVLLVTQAPERTA